MAQRKPKETVASMLVRLAVEVRWPDRPALERENLANALQLILEDGVQGLENMIEHVTRSEIDRLMASGAPLI